MKAENVRKQVAIVGTVDTKGEEIGYLKRVLEERGLQVLIIDISCREVSSSIADISNRDVAEKAERRIGEVAGLKEDEAIDVMGLGASRICHRLYSSGRLHGVIGLGGTMGTWLGETVMRSLPFGLPKLMISTVAFSAFIDSEITAPGQMLTDCVAGLWGLNTISKAMLSNAAAAIAGMIENYKGIAPENAIVGITTLGSAALSYVPHLKSRLEQRQYEVAVFHAHETGGKAFEMTISEGLTSVALDLCLFDLANYVGGGSWSSRPDRLEIAGKRGIPQIVAPGAIDFISFAAPPESIPSQFRGRPLHSHNPKDTCVATSANEKRVLGELIAQKLNRATGPAVMLLPYRGFSEWSREDQIFYDPGGTKKFMAAFKQNIGSKVQVVELDAHINDPVFIEAVMSTFDELI